MYLHFIILFPNVYLLIPACLFNLHVYQAALPQASPGVHMGSVFIQFQHSHLHTPTHMALHTTD
jgi:hypothetical protein